MPTAAKTCCCRAKADRAGFTLIEILVVVAIIALLISILLPSLARARMQARNTLCLSNLGQQGKAAFMYAHETKGYLPHSHYLNSIEVLHPKPAKQLVRMLSNHPEIFFCPENLAIGFRDWTPETFKRELAEYEANPKVNPVPPVHIGYWWVANPPINDKIPLDSFQQPRQKYIDADNDGETEDEYVIRLEQRDLHKLVVSTDQSGQTNRDPTGWYFFHGKQAVGRGKVDTRGCVSGWKNSLYADGHAGSVPGFKVVERWGKRVSDSGNPAGW